MSARTGSDRPHAGTVQRRLPIPSWLPTYDRAWLTADAIAGLSVWALLVPQSLSTVKALPHTDLTTLAVGAGSVAVCRQCARGPDVALTHVHPPVLAPWRRAGLYDVVADDQVFTTVRDAVAKLTALRDAVGLPAGRRDAPTGRGATHAHANRAMPADRTGGTIA